MRAGRGRGTRRSGTHLPSSTAGAGGGAPAPSQRGVARAAAALGPCCGLTLPQADWGSASSCPGSTRTPAASSASSSARPQVQFLQACTQAGGSRRSGAISKKGSKDANATRPTFLPDLPTSQSSFAGASGFLRSSAGEKGGWQTGSPTAAASAQGRGLTRGLDPATRTYRRSAGRPRRSDRRLPPGSTPQRQEPRARGPSS